MKRKKKFSFALFYQKFGVLTLLVILFAVASIISPNFLKTRNLINILRQIVIITIIACGACFILICGQIIASFEFTADADLEHTGAGSLNGSAGMYSGTGEDTHDHDACI